MLLIDDDEISLSLVSMQLSSAGFTVLPADSGEAALRLAADTLPAAAPDIVLTDLQMPGLCGRELALALHTLLPEATLIAMSASPGDSSGYHGFVSKPLNLEGLQNVIENSRLPLQPAAANRQDEPLQLAILDENTYQKLSSMMPAPALAEVYEVCLKDTRLRSRLMLEAAGEDESRLRQIAHTVKGGAAMVGAAQTAATAAFLEAGRYSPADVPDLINKLLFSCDQLERILMTKVHPY
ncbi:response regulator [Silvibacterium sp.]|uniref:response regulator n=1 Tax=Silvibacterium sp. TaxID=1964179 RepID=UPI0039E241BC